MFGVAANPLELRSGAVVATKFEETATPGLYHVFHTREVKVVGLCASKRGFVHLDSECYDPRFSTIVVPIK